jgi:hypothetical protein
VADSDGPGPDGFTANVLQTASTDFRNTTITTTLDTMGRLRTKALPALNGESAKTIRYTYNTSAHFGLLEHVDTLAGATVTRTTYYGKGVKP